MDKPKTYQEAAEIRECSGGTQRAAEIFNRGDAQRVITSGKKNKKSFKNICEIV